MRAGPADRLLRASMDTLLDLWVLMRAVRDDESVIVDFRHLEANREACRVNGREHDDLVGPSLLELLPALRGGLLNMYAAVVDTGTPLALDDHPFDMDGQTRWYDNRAVRVGDDELSFTWRDVTEAHHLRSSLAHMANTDPLTGLNNRFGLEQALDRLNAEDRRRAAAIAVLYLDLGGMNAINNIHGHSAGDRVLGAVGERIASAVRSSDIVVRVGGGESVVVTPHTELAGAHTLAGKIQAAMSTPPPDRRPAAHPLGERGCVRRRPPRRHRGPPRRGRQRPDPHSSAPDETDPTHPRQRVP